MRSAAPSPGAFHRERGEPIVGSQYPRSKRNIGTTLCAIVIKSRQRAIRQAASVSRSGARMALCFMHRSHQEEPPCPAQTAGPSASRRTPARPSCPRGRRHSTH
ncbi:hypothetical protein EGY31_10525 [Burkholderia multivorans]|nr:hypothetical protein EGY31_10525 [Burkholderia multivorans]